MNQGMLLGLDLREKNISIGDFTKNVNSICCIFTLVLCSQFSRFKFLKRNNRNVENINIEI